ncbi:hypothetical protein [Streptomyces sp. NPDC057748]|uniref:hypothetical protein n=1 Tax=unclassified Streptomyces TaxID=2593676 RepID=UPI0036C630A6
MSEHRIALWSVEGRPAGLVPSLCEQLRGDPPPPAGAVEITEAEYNAGVAAIEAANAAKVAEEEEAAAQERARLDCEALIAAGIPPETAARMSGYNPPHPTVDGTQKSEGV